MSNKRLISCLCGVVLLFAAGVVLSTIGQAPAPTTQQRKTSTPYTGDLSIFDYPDRDRKLHINQVMDLLGISPGKSVADIGAGSGWFTVRAAQRVAPTGTVYAVDINPAAIQYVDDRAKKEKLNNVKTVLGTAGDPRLPSESVNAVLLLKTYHEVAQPVEFMTHLRSSLRPDARVGIIDRNGNGENHGVAKKIVIQEVESAGYRLAEEHDELVRDDKMDYFLVFVAK
jgi:predicted methyltransferase